MHQYRQVLVRIRHGDSDRELARCRYMGRRKLATLRELAEHRGWLEPDALLPDDAEIAAALGSPRKATSTVSGLEVHRALIASWLEQNVPGTAILAALRREHGYTGSYSSVYRMIVSINADRPLDVTVPLSFAPGVTDRRNRAGDDRRNEATWNGPETRFRRASRMRFFA